MGDKVICIPTENVGTRKSGGFLKSGRFENLSVELLQPDKSGISSRCGNNYTLRFFIITGLSKKSKNAQNVILSRLEGREKLSL